MTTDQAHTAAPDARQVAALIGDLGIGRRAALSYPPGHPQIESAFAKVHGTYTRLLSAYPRIILGVARDALVLSDKFVGGSEFPVCRDFARLMHDRGVRAFALNPGFNRQDFDAFNSVIGFKREEIFARGGIASVWKECGPAALTITAIQYDLFLMNMTEELEITESSNPVSQALLWEKFVRELTCAAPGASERRTDLLDPEIVAEILNSLHEASDGSALPGTDGFGAMLRQFDTPRGTAQEFNAFKHIAELINNLKPELRNRFFAGTLESSKQTGEPYAMEIVPHLSSEAIISVLEDIRDGRMTIPTLVKGLMKKLGAAAGAPHGLLSGLEPQDAASSLRTLFREHASEEYIPEEYLRKLDKIVSRDSISGISLKGSGIDLGDLEPLTVDKSVVEILLQLVRQGAGDQDRPLIEALANAFGEVLKEGEFSFALHIVRNSLDPQVHPETRESLLEEFSTQDNINELITGMKTWGKSVFDEVRSLIAIIGTPCINPLLTQLAEEDNMSIRRFMIERIMEFGDQCRDSIIARLNDGRWYYVRNLVIILRDMNDPSCAPMLRPLLRHANEKVRVEALRTLLQFGDSLAEQQVFSDLVESRKENRLSIIAMAGACRSQRVFDYLSGIALKSGTSREDYAEREAAVTALAESRSLQAFELLTRILASRSLFAPRLHQKLKIRCLFVLEKCFPASRVKPLAEKYARDGGELGAAASAARTRLEKRRD